MATRASSLLSLLVLLALFLFPHEAHAWVETNIRSHQARIEVNRDGSAIVRHELLIKLRGGPTKAIEVGGVGNSIVPLPDALVRRAAEGSASKWPLTVSSLEDGSVRLKILNERGIRGGSYLFSFAYSIDLNELNWITPTQSGAEITWVGPRLVSGVDSAKATFVIPRGELPPRLASTDGASGGVLLGEVRRGAEVDEVELIRAHLATGEPAVWKILVSSEVLDQAPALSVEQLEKSPLILSKSRQASAARLSERSSRTHLLIAFSLALLYGGLVFLKAWLASRAARLFDARLKPLFPGPPWVRGLLATAFLGVGAWFALDRQPWIAVGLGALAASSATHLLPVRIVKPRGPGKWERVDSTISQKVVTPPGGIFETTKIQGFGFLCLLVLPIVAVAYRLLPISNYYALMTTVLALLLVPLFWTGRVSDLPGTPRAQAEPWMRYLSRAIDPSWAQIELWGRCPDVGDLSSQNPTADSVYDEVRLRMVLSSAPAGLRALELSLDEAAGSCVLPCVVLRVLEDSPSLELLPADLPWQRGRRPEERVALLRPTAPTRAQTLRLVKALIVNLRGAGKAARKKTKLAA